MNYLNIFVERIDPFISFFLVCPTCPDFPWSIKMKEFQLFFLKERVILIGINSLPPPEKKKKKRINEAKKKKK